VKLVTNPQYDHFVAELRRTKRRFSKWNGIAFRAAHLEFIRVVKLLDGKGSFKFGGRWSAAGTTNTLAGSWKPETRNPKGLLVKGQGVNASGPSAKLGDQSIRESSASLFEGHHGPENFLLVFHHQDFHLKDAFNRGGNLKGRQAVGAIQDPHDLSHRHHADKAGVRQVQPAFNDFRCFERLSRVILGEVAYDNIRIETDHWRFARGEPPDAPSAAALVI